MDFDGFFQRKDSLDQLQEWREAIAKNVLALPSASLLRLQRVKRGSLDLEFVVEVGSGISDAELQARLQREAGHLRELFQEPVLELRVGNDGVDEEPVHVSRPKASANEPQRLSDVSTAVGAATPHGMATPHWYGQRSRDPSPMSGVGGRQYERLLSEEERMRQQEYEQALIDSNDRYSSSFAGWEWQRGRSGAAAVGDSMAHSEHEIFGHASLDAASRPLGRSQSASAHTMAMAAARQRALDRLNHPTIPSGPTFLRGDSHWELRNGARISEVKKEEERVRREKEQEESHRPFRARPVPAAVLTPRFQALQCASRRSRSAEGVRSRHESPQWRGVRPDPEEQPPPFRARPVPWRVSTPLFEQMQAEEREARRYRQSLAARESLRSASLPPRLQAEVDAARQADQEQAEDRSPGIRRGPTGHRLAGEGHRDIGRSWASGVEHCPSGVSAGRHLPGHPSTPSGGHSTPSGRRAKQRQVEPAETRKPIAYPTTEVPDFASLHEREKNRLERIKYLNRYVTQPEPFVFADHTKRSEAGRAPMSKDPSRDWRFRRNGQSRAGSAPGASRSSTFERRGGHFSVRALERPSTVVPPRTTEKVLQHQASTQRRMQQRREKELREKQQLEEAHQVSSELRLKIQEAVGPMEPLEEKIDRMVGEKRISTNRITREKCRDLQRIQERVARRPLLMEQADSLVRARRRALFRVRSALEAAGVRDVESHFCDEELDEFDRAQAREHAEPIACS
eukprot:TRINITY_DN63964_c0_g1_i1.p1 TRINITY_DN63964_c0_g1~~TRINITY_DN63964_c0_g1_i1.p1  ORF type:complete len:805 (-),score=146.63 TRINITY_DN63964_c0_g1_i1:182-2404(-)